jgi:hypothetical protein
MLTAFVPHFIRPQFSVGISDIDQTTYTGINSGNPVTFPNMDAGWPRADRLLIALISSRDGAEDATFTRACTIGGVSAPEVVISGVATGGSTMFGGVYAAIVPDGMTANVVFQTTGYAHNFDAWQCTLIRATGLASTTAITTATGGSSGFITLNTAGAKFAVTICSEHNDNLSAVDPYSSSGGSTLVKGHQTTYGFAFIDTTPSGASTIYSIDGYSSNRPNTVAGACWG